MLDEILWLRYDARQSVGWWHEKSPEGTPSGLWLMRSSVSTLSLAMISESGE